jgi:DNA polymerase I-like protein with 3'-5' exonuclease and polymerase domains
MKWFKLDMAKAARYLRGEWEFPLLEDGREWVFNQPERFPEFVDQILEHSHLVAVDSETEPLPIVAFATEWAVHAFVLDHRTHDEVQRLMAAPQVLKIAHNWAHDLPWFERRLMIDVASPMLDTMGWMHNLEPEAQKSLSPHMSTSFTTWPYHKWMFNVNAVAYCGMDAAVCLDAYWPMVDEIQPGSELWNVTGHDQKLNGILMRMMLRGTPINAVKRQEAEDDLREVLFEAETEFKRLAKPVVESRLHAFEKPHLFRKQRSCACCGGGSLQCEACWQCGGLPSKPERKSDYAPLMTGFDNKWTVAQAKARLPRCETCAGSGKITIDLPIMYSSKDQMRDVLYKGLGVRPRKFKGKVTVKMTQLEPLEDEHVLIAAYLKTARLDAEYKTVSRLRPDSDDRLHSILDPWGTVSGRVAGKEGLILTGTNPMNIPYKARRFIEAPEGEFLLYPDMDQIEARVVALLSKDPLLCDIFERAKTDPTVDFHREVMRLIREQTGFDFNEIDIGPHAGDGRFFSKKTSYAMFYGIRAAQLAKELGVDLVTANQIVRAYSKTFVGVPYYHKKVESQMQRDRTWRSPTGRFRRFLDRVIDKKTKGIQYEILKKAWSGPPQDVAAWVLAEGLFKIDEEHRGLLTPFLHVHDALLLSAPFDRKHEAVAAVADAMTMELFGMHFTGGVSVGPDWYCASLDDADKAEAGYGEWTLKNFLGD